MKSLLLAIIVSIMVSSCSEYQTHRYGELQDNHIGYKTRAFYITTAKGLAKENYPKISLKQFGPPIVFRRVGWRRFIEKDQVNVRWMQTVDDENLRASRNPITIESLNVELSRSGVLMDNSYGFSKGHALFITPEIEALLKAQQGAASDR